MKIISVKINNILSIEDALVEFSDSGLMLVQGWNYDNSRANGAGKTAIFNAIAYALYDKLPRKITSTEILRRGSKSGYVEVCFKVDGCVYVVKRSRPKGFSICKNGNLVDITQQGLEQILKINYSQFMLSMYCAQGSSSRFLSVNDSDKKLFLLQLLNLEEFSSCRVLADNKVKAMEEERVAIESKIEALDSKVDAYSESLVDDVAVNYHVDLANKIIVDLTSQLIQVQNVTKPNLSKYQKLEDDILARQNIIVKARANREMLHDQYRKVNSLIRPFNKIDTCRSCGSRLDITSAKTVHEHDMAEHIRELALLKKQIDACEEALVGESNVNLIYQKLKDKKREESKGYEIASIKASEITSKIQKKQQEVENLNIKLQNNDELQSKIKNLCKTRQLYVNNRDIILRKIELYKTISTMYSPMGAQAYILDSVVESFNEVVDKYIKLLWSDLTYELKSYKETVKGDITAKFSEVLTMGGKPASIGSLSGGEFRALSLCVDFALISVMERQFGIDMSPIVLDEPFDGLDIAGRELIIELLESISSNRQVVVIDHATEIQSMFSKVIIVEKRNGISTVSVQA